MVISQKIYESIMGYRGSKSVILNNIAVKEQRVDGSLSLKLQLRGIKCILMGFERNYQIRILSNQINLRGTQYKVFDLLMGYYLEIFMTWFRFNLIKL